MLKLKGQAECGEWVEFNISQVYDVCLYDNRWYIKGYPNDYVIDTTTIQPADDPRKHPMFTITCPNCDYEYMDPFEDGSFECPECELYLPPKNDPRKAMLDEIRNQLAVLPSPSFCDDCFNDGFSEAVHKVFDLIDEMEAKL